MRILVKVTIPVEAGNLAATKKFSAIQQIVEQQKPEAAYFIEEHGKRTAILIVNMEHASGIPALAEPWFLALNASVELHPVMLPADLAAAGEDVAKAVKDYAS